MAGPQQLNDGIICIDIRHTWRYIYIVPFVESQDRIFLKTIIPSRKMTRLYLKGGGS